MSDLPDKIPKLPALPPMSTSSHFLDEASLWLLLALLGGSGASALALGLLLRGDKRLTRRMVIGTVLHSQAWGTAVFLLLADQTSMSIPVMLGVAVFSGMGVASFLDVVVLVLRRQLGFLPPREINTKE